MLSHGRGVSGSSSACCTFVHRSVPSFVQFGYATSTVRRRAIRGVYSLQSSFQTRPTSNSPLPMFSLCGGAAGMIAAAKMTSQRYVYYTHSARPRLSNLFLTVLHMKWERMLNAGIVTTWTKDSKVHLAIVRPRILHPGIYDPGSGNLTNTNSSIERRF
jgi:hypothetical protein